MIDKVTPQAVGLELNFILWLQTELIMIAIYFFDSY